MDMNSLRNREFIGLDLGILFKIPRPGKAEKGRINLTIRESMSTNPRSQIFKNLHCKYRNLNFPSEESNVKIHASINITFHNVRLYISIWFIFNRFYRSPLLLFNMTLILMRRVVYIRGVRSKSKKMITVECEKNNRLINFLLLFFTPCIVVSDALELNNLTQGKL